MSLNHRTCDGNTLFHLAAWYETQIYDDFAGRLRRVCYLSCVETVRFIIDSGGLVNAVNNETNTPLHLATSYRPSPDGLRVLREVLEALLNGGAHADMVNKNRKTAMDVAETDEARSIVSKRTKIELNLKRIAARAVRKFGLSHVGLVPKDVENLIISH